jgi:hypothetical protein
MGIKSKRINILAVYEESFKDPHRYDKLKIILPIAGIVIVIMIASGLSFYARMVSQSDLNDVNWKVVKTKAALSVADKESYEETKTLISDNQKITKFNKSLDDYVPFTQKIGDDLYNRAEKSDCQITQMTFSKDNNAVTVQGTTISALNVNEYVDEISKNTHYDKVTFNGYTSDNSQEDTTQQNTTDQNATEEDTTGNQNTTQPSNYTYHYSVSFQLKGGM